MRVVLKSTKKEADNITTFYFEPPQKVDYTAGQFIEMHLPHPHPDKRGTKHWFTLSSSPTSDLISITTKFAGDKSSSFKKKLFSLKPGDKVEISDPMGDFVLPKDRSIPLVFVAGGIGITPFHSIIQWLSDTQEKRDIQFIYSVRNEKEMVFVDLFEKYGAEVKVIVSELSPGWQGETGQLSAKRILENVKPLDNKLVFISGPEPMVETFEKDLHQLKVPKRQLVLDFFPNYSGI